MAVVYFNTCGQEYDNSTVSQEWDILNNPNIVSDVTYGYVMQLPPGAYAVQNLNAIDDGIYNSTYSFNGSVLSSSNNGLIFSNMTACVNGLSQIAVFNKNTGQLICTSGVISNPNAFHCFEFKWSISAQSLIIRLDGNVVFSGAGLPNFPTSGAASYGAENTSGSTTIMAIMTVQDLTGPAPWNDMVGEFKPFVLFPTGAGLDTEWTNSFSVNNYAQVNSRIAPGDTSYLSSDTIGNIDLYTIGSLPVDVISVAACMGKINGKKIVGGTRDVAFALYPGSGSPVLGTPAAIASGQYLEYITVFAENPITSSSWVLSDFTSLQIGMKVTS